MNEELTPEQRLEKLESDLKVIADVAASTADDLLRTNFILRELEDNGYLPVLPWELVSKKVDLYHSVNGRSFGDVKAKDGRPINQAIAELESEIAELREEFIQRANEQIQR